LERASYRNFSNDQVDFDTHAHKRPVRLAGCGWLVLICCERKVLLAGCWWLVCSEREVLLADG
jgi:hypothetical protein